MLLQVVHCTQYMVHTHIPLGGGAPVGGFLGTPPYIPQNDPLVALIILNTHMWILKRNLPTGGPVPAARLGGGGMRDEFFFPILHAYLNSP